MMASGRRCRRRRARLSGCVSLIRDGNLEVISKAEAIWLEDAGGVRSCRAHQCFQSIGC
jgi:hypothetical protein